MDRATQRTQFLADLPFKTDAELQKLHQRNGILTTDLVKQTEPDLLPWKWPMLVGLRDLMNGKGWTGGFRSKTIFCLSSMLMNT